MESDSFKLDARLAFGPLSDHTGKTKYHAQYMLRMAESYARLTYMFYITWGGWVI